MLPVQDTADELGPVALIISGRMMACARYGVWKVETTVTPQGAELVARKICVVHKIDLAYRALKLERHILPMLLQMCAKHPLVGHLKFHPTDSAG